MLSPRQIPTRCSAPPLAGRGDLTRLLPELTAAASSGRRPGRKRAASSGCSSRRRLLHRAWSPVVLVVEDLHWADDATLALLAYLLRDHTLPGLVTIATTARPMELSPLASGLITGIGPRARGRPNTAGWTRR